MVEDMVYFRPLLVSYNHFKIWKRKRNSELQGKAIIFSVVSQRPRLYYMAHGALTADHVPKINVSDGIKTQSLGRGSVTE